MHEIKLTKETIDGSEVEVYSREIWDANVIRVSAGTTGFCGGDSGHGGRTIIGIEDLGSTDLRIRVKTHSHFGECDTYETEDAEKIEIILGGDAELVTIVKGLKWIRKALKEIAWRKQ